MMAKVIDFIREKDGKEKKEGKLRGGRGTHPNLLILLHFFVYKNPFFLVFGAIFCDFLRFFYVFGTFFV